MIAGGTEAPLTFGTLMAWEALKTLAQEDVSNPAASCKPFARDRTGLVLGEGAAILVLEDAEHARLRGARVHAEVAGYGLATDTEHITRPSVRGQAQAMARALDSAGLAPSDIGYINAHGTGTQANDAVETAAIKEVFGDAARTLPDQLHQVHARPSARGGGSSRVHHRDPRPAARHRSADRASARPRSRMRPRLRRRRRAAHRPARRRSCRTRSRSAAPTPC